ncbi:GNAT family protein [Paenibacillus sp. FSL M8-0334]|uniref:GNAT family N-acetyltransferase n=1 Tax=Paenibacillus sp. FSL M8-0334 TaxID=2921623 RepID=UPI0030F6ED98
MYRCQGDIPELTGERIRLRRMEPSDGRAMYACWADAQTARFLEIPAINGAEAAAALIASLNKLAEEDEALRWGIELRQTGTLIGSCGYNLWQLQGVYRGEIGCELASAYWGQGYMQEALSLCIDYGFSQMELNRIEAYCDRDNGRATAFFHKMGFVLEGTLREYRYSDRGAVDAVVLSILRREWNALPPQTKA